MDIEEIKAEYAGEDLSHGCDFCLESFSNRMDRKEHTLTHFLEKSCSGCSIPLVRIADGWYIAHDEQLCIDGNTNEKASANTDPLFIHVPIKSESEQPCLMDENEELLEQKCFARDEHPVAVESEPTNSEGIDAFAEQPTAKPLKLRRNVKKRTIRFIDPHKRPANRRIRCGICKSISKDAWSFKRHMKTAHSKTNANTNDKCIDIGGQKLTIIDDIGSDASKFMSSDNDKKSSLRPIRCEKCDRVLKTEWCFKRHVRSIHKNDQSCVGVRVQVHEHNVPDGVEYSKREKGNLPNTIQSRRRLRCKICKKKFATPFSLKRHMKNFHNRTKAESDTVESVLDFGGQQITIVKEPSSVEGAPNDSDDDEASTTVISNSLWPIRCELCKNILRNNWSFKRHVKTIHKNVPNCVGARLKNVLVKEVH